LSFILFILISLFISEIDLFKKKEEEEDMEMEKEKEKETKKRANSL